MGGNFNEITRASKKYGDLALNNTRSDKFIRCLNYWNIIDVGYTGSKYTWSNNRHITNWILERTDRFVANYDWINLFPQALVQHLPRTYSDHCPLLIHLNKKYTIMEKKIRFETIWQTHPQFLSIIQRNWTINKPLLPAIEDFTKDVTIWNKFTFGNIFRKKVNC